MARDKSATAPAANKPPTVSFLDYLPNNYIEKTKDVNEGVPHYDDAIGRNFHELSAAGRVATMLQYVTILVAVIAIVTSRALVGAEVAFTANKPTYEDYIALEENEDVLNLQCDTSNSTLIYNEFAKVEYEQSGVCDMIAADLLLNKLGTIAHSGSGPSSIVPKSLTGAASACKVNAQTEYVCRVIDANCKKGKKQIDALVERVLSASLALPSLASRAFLKQTLSIQTNLTIQASLDSARDSQDSVLSWASENMPVLYGFMQMHMNAIQALRYAGTRDTVLQGIVNTECARAAASCSGTAIGDGNCNAACNVPECLYDGGDCIDFTQLFSTGPNVKTEYNWNNANSNFDVTDTYMGYAALALGNHEDINTNFASVNLNDATMSSPTNAFVHFDDDLCAKSATWSKTRTTNMTTNQVNNQVSWATYSYYSNLFTTDGVEMPGNKPDGDPPYATTMTFACDRYVNRLSNAGYKDFTSEKMLAWAEHYDAMSRKLVEVCASYPENYDGCHSTHPNLVWLADEAEQQFFLDIKRGAVVNMAIENSGSLAELTLDASLKKNSSGFAIFPTVDHEKYFKYAGVSSCKYTKKLKPEPGALTTVILGVIGGIVNLSTYVGVGFYVFSKKRILKRDAALHGSAA